MTVWLPVLACGPEAGLPVLAAAVACLVVSGLGVASGVGEAAAVVGCVAAAGDCGVAEGDGVAAGVVGPVGVVRPSPEAAPPPVDLGVGGVGGLCARGEATAHDGQGRQDRDHLTDRTTAGPARIVQTHGFSPQLSPTGLVPRPRPHPESRRPRGVIRTQGDLQTEADPTTLQVPDGVFAYSESYKYRKQSQHA